MNIKLSGLGGKPLKVLSGACLLGLTGAAIASPVLYPAQWQVAENTASNQFVGQVVATNASATKQLQLEVGTVSTKEWITNGGTFESVNFTAPFATQPTIVSQVQSYGNYTVMYRVDTYSYKGWQSKKGYEIFFRPRMQNASNTGFETILETDIDMKGSSVVEEFGSIGGNETIGWLAINSAEQGQLNGLSFETIQTPVEVTQANKTVNFSGPFYQAPNMFSSVTTTNGTDQVGVGVEHIRDNNSKIYMDELDDGDHNAEAVSMLMLQGAGNLYDAQGQLIGEVGSVQMEDSRRADAHTIALTRSFNNPVVFVQAVGVDEKIHDADFRFTNIAANQFSGYLHGDNESTGYGTFDTFELQYLVLEAGSWQLNLENYSYEIVAGNDSGAFKIDSNTGEIFVDKSTELDFESGVIQYNLTVQVTDGTGDSTTTTVTVDITNVSDSLNSDSQAIYGLGSNDWLGYGATAAGDVNGDGFDDLIIGAPNNDTNGGDAGAAYVLFGNATGVLANLSDVVNGIGGFAIYGERGGDKAGFAVAGNGDINGDGLADVVIGAPYADDYGDQAGKVYVVFGKADSTAVQLSEVADDNNVSGFAMLGRSTFDHAGGSLVVSDFNADGLADIHIGEVVRKSTTAGWGFSSTQYGVPNLNYTVFGKTDGASIALSDIASDDDNRGFAIVKNNRKISDREQYGAQVLPLGDFNSDGLNDYIYNQGVFGASNGRNYVQLGRATSHSLTKTEAETQGIIINPEPASYVFNWVYKGTSTANTLPSFITSPAGDVNGDGIDDIAVISADNNCCAGFSNPRAYIVYGSTTPNSVIELADIAQGIGGFVIENDYSQIAHEQWKIVFGAIGGAGDLNGDGYDDVIIGDQYAESGNGRYFVVYGKADQSAVMLSDVVNGIGGFSSAGNGGDALGHWLGTAGDLNGDGIADMFVTAPMADPDGLGNAGTVYVMLGKGDAITTWGSNAADEFTLGLASAQNVTGGEGDDKITKSSSADSIFAGPGDDIITVKDGNIQRIDGGNGFDTLVFDGQNLLIDLASKGSQVRSIEKIDIRGTGANQLAFNKLISSTGSVVIQGDADDVVYSTNQQWQNSNVTEVIDNVTYQVYTAGDAKMYLQSGVTISVNAAPVIAAQNYTIEEYTQGGTFIGNVLADPSDEGDAVSYAIITGNEQNLFTIDALTGALKVADAVGRIDYESAAAHILTVQVTDQFSATAQADITVNVTNLSEMTHSVKMDASGASSIWGDWGSLANLLGERWEQGFSVQVGLSGRNIDTPILDLTADGTLGLDVSAVVEGGIIDATLPVDFSVNYPDEVQPGNAFELTTQFGYGEGAGFEVTSPYLSVNGKLWLEDYYFYVGTDLPNMFSSKVDKFNGEISGQYDSYTHTYESKAHIARGIQAADNQLRFDAEIDDPTWIDQQVTYPKNWGGWAMGMRHSVEKCEDGFFTPMGGEDLSMRMEFSMMEAYLWFTSSLNQKFSVELKPTATLVLEDGTEIAFDPLQNVQITPQLEQDVNGDGVIDATLRVQLNSSFKNDTDLINYARLPLKSAYVNYNIQEALCTANNVYLYGKNGVYFEKEEAGPMIDLELKAELGWDGETDVVQDVYEFALNEIVYVEKLSFDLCDGEGSACAAPLVPDNTAPTADSVEISGFAKVDSQLSASYQYFDADADQEMGSSFQWYRAFDGAGQSVEAINGATAKQYTVTAADSGQYLQFCVEPSDGKDLGTQVCSGFTLVSTLNTELDAGFAEAVQFTVAGKQYTRIPMSGAFNPAANDFTFETWVKVDDYGSTGNMHFIQQRNGSGTGRTILGIKGGTGRFYSYLGRTNLQSSTVVTKGQWYHLALSYEKSSRKLKMYVNGQLEAQGTRSIESTKGDLVFSANKDMNNRYLDGAMDETRLWQSLRTQTQLQSSMKLAVDPQAEGLMAYYKFDSDDGVTLHDETAQYPGSYANSPSFTSGPESVVISGSGSLSGVLPAKSSGEFVLEVAPQFGQLTLDAATGQFVYVPNDTSLTVNDSFSYFVQNSQNQHGSTVVVSVNVVGQ
ncbi:cadherin domain-containing protein [Pseudoalteromonas phenolica]|uniref:cadherin domain-containing protein n=1 Tax=Pseudoalteromonas phenolica TaxID=161398 RepID=UPI00384B4C59